MILREFPSGDILHRYKKSLVLTFAHGRKVASTAAHNGGVQNRLNSVFNHDGTLGAGVELKLEAPSYEGHMKLVATRLGLDPEASSGMLTAAQMENVAIETASAANYSVTAIVTGGIEYNGGRAGDPAGWDEGEGQGGGALGTINTILYIDADLTDGALLRSIVTATEAKTAALLELEAPSRYSTGLATGSGTDSVIAVSNPHSPIKLTDAGKHSRLGELIGTAEKAAVKKTLLLQTSLGPQSQHSAIKRLERYKVTEDSVWEAYHKMGSLSRAMFSDCAEKTLSEAPLPLYASLYAHVLDEMGWGLASKEEAFEAAQGILTLLGQEGQPFPEGGGDVLTALTSAMETALANIVLAASAARAAEQ